eukprot:g32435.t1
MWCILVWQPRRLGPSDSGAPCEDVHFRYPTDLRNGILNGFTMTVEPKTKVALVGEAGCGKSSCMALLQRFYDPTQGCIRIDGVDLREYNVNVLRSRVAVVDQRPVLFASSVRENVTYGLRHEVSDEEVIQVLQAASLWDGSNGIKSKADRLLTKLGSGGISLSGGQMQRVSIARVMIRKPDIILLDEATSALDNKNEKIVQAALDQLAHQGSALVIAHRLTTIKDADKIVVMRKGQVAEEEVAHGIYRFLWELQFADETETADSATEVSAEVPSRRPSAETPILNTTTSSEAILEEEDAELFLSPVNEKIPMDKARPASGRRELKTGKPLDTETSGGGARGSAFPGGRGEPDPLGGVDVLVPARRDLLGAGAGLRRPDLADAQESQAQRGAKDASAALGVWRNRMSPAAFMEYVTVLSVEKGQEHLYKFMSSLSLELTWSRAEARLYEIPAVRQRLQLEHGCHFCDWKPVLGGSVFSVLFHQPSNAQMHRDDVESCFNTVSSKKFTDFHMGQTLWSLFKQKIATGDRACAKASYSITPLVQLFQCRNQYQALLLKVVVDMGNESQCMNTVVGRAILAETHRRTHWGNLLETWDDENLFVLRIDAKAPGVSVASLRSAVFGADTFLDLMYIAILIRMSFNLENHTYPETPLIELFAALSVWITGSLCLKLGGGMYLFRGTRAGLAVGLLKHLSLGETTAGCAGPPPTVRGKKTKSERQRGHHKFLQLAGNSFSNFARATRSPFVRQRNTKPKSLRSCLLTDVRLCSSFCDRALRDLYTVALSAIEVFSVYVGCRFIAYGTSDGFQTNQAWELFQKHPGFLSALVLTRWMQVLFSVCQLEGHATNTFTTVTATAVTPQIPVPLVLTDSPDSFHVRSDVAASRCGFQRLRVNFILVLMLGVMASFHAYFVFPISENVGSINNVLNGFLKIFRLELLGDFDLAELEGLGERLSGNFTHGYFKGKMGEDAHTNIHRWLRFDVVVTVVAMNVYIGLLGELYSKAVERKNGLYNHWLASTAYRFLCRQIGVRLKTLLDDGRSGDGPSLFPSLGTEGSSRWILCFSSRWSRFFATPSFRSSGVRWMWYVYQAPANILLLTDYAELLKYLSAADVHVSFAAWAQRDVLLAKALDVPVFSDARDDLAAAAPSVDFFALDDTTWPSLLSALAEHDPALSHRAAVGRAGGQLARSRGFFGELVRTRVQQLVDFLEESDPDPDREESGRLRVGVLAQLHDPKRRSSPSTMRGIFLQQLLLARELSLESDVIFKLHTKKRKAWRDLMIEPLFGSVQVVQSILQQFESDRMLGMMGPTNLTWRKEGPTEHVAFDLAKFGFDPDALREMNFVWSLLKPPGQAGNELPPAAAWTIIAGSFYWIRAGLTWEEQILPMIPRLLDTWNRTRTGRRRTGFPCPGASLGIRSGRSVLESVTFSRGISWSPGDTPLLPAADTPNTGKAQVTEGLHATPDAAIAVQKHKKHNAKCNPCVYLAGSYGCTSPACPFCHHTLAVPNQRRGRPRKRVRDTYKNMLDAILQRPNDAARHMALQSLAAEDPYVRLLITGRLDAEFAATHST